MHRRSTSYGNLAGDGAVDLPLGPRLPPRSPLSATLGQRTPPTCPASPLIGGTPRPAGSVATSPAPPAPLPGGTVAPARSAGSTPARLRSGGVCRALPQVDFAQSHVLNNIVTSVLESNLTAEQCFSAYGRMHTAPPLVGMNHGSAAGHHHHHHGGVGHPGAADVAAAVDAGSAAGLIRAAGAASAGSAALAGGLVAHVNLINDLNDVDFGLATCLATPLDPGTGLKRRPALAQQLPATTTAAARSAAYKLTSANDILQETSRFGDAVRRQRRWRKLERMQKLLVELGADAVLGRLVDDTLLESDPAGRRRRHLLQPPPPPQQQQERDCPQRAHEDIGVFVSAAAVATAANADASVGGTGGFGATGSAGSRDGGAATAGQLSGRDGAVSDRDILGRCASVLKQSALQRSRRREEEEDEEEDFPGKFKGFRDDMQLVDVV